MKPIRKNVSLQIRREDIQITQLGSEFSQSQSQQITHSSSYSHSQSFSSSNSFQQSPQIFSPRNRLSNSSSQSSSSRSSSGLVSPRGSLSPRSRDSKRKVTWKSKNASEEKRDIAMINANESTHSLLSEKELKYIDKVQDRRKLMLSSLNINQKLEIVLDIQCLSKHVLTTIKEPMNYSLSLCMEKWLKENTKEIVDVSQLIYRTETGKILSRNLTLRGVLTVNCICVFVSYENRPFTLPKIYPMEITWNDNRVVPQVVFNMCWWIYTYGYLIEGIFRVPGNVEFMKKKVEKLCHCDTSFLYSMDRMVQNVHNVVGILKLYFREKTIGLIPFHMVQDFPQQKEERYEYIKNTLIQLNESDMLSLSILFGLINRLTKYETIHMMTLKNFGMILGPMIIHTPPGMNAFQTTGIQLDFSYTLGVYYEELMRELGYENPFNELPDRDDIYKFNKEKIDEKLNKICSNENDIYKECKELRKMMEDPQTIQYLHSLPPNNLLDVVSVIVDVL